jgi:prepilin-type N-terminal cleavage/methylation domain-containing protein
MPASQRPIRTSADAPPTARAGFTLFELLLVLTVLAVLVGISWPSLNRYIAEQRLRQDVGLVRDQLARVRVKAIDTGLVYQFRYEPGGRAFVVLPYDLPDEYQHTGSGTGTSTSPRVYPTVTGRLDASCRFFVDQSPATVGTPVATERLSDEWLAMVAEGPQLAQLTWSPPVLFYPDGTADDCVLQVADDEQRLMSVTVRGLTAAVSVGPMEQEGPL